MPSGPRSYEAPYIRAIAAIRSGRCYALRARPRHSRELNGSSEINSSSPSGVLRSRSLCSRSNVPEYAVRARGVLFWRYPSRIRSTIFVNNQSNPAANHPNFQPTKPRAAITTPVQAALLDNI